MSISLEKHTQILAKTRISFSLEDEILIVAKDVITHLEANKEESTFAEPSISDEEHLFELEIEEDEKGISGEYQAIERCIEQWFQVSMKLDQFCFCFYFANLHLQYLISHIFEYIKFDFLKSYVNILLFLLHVWFHWKFHYT